MNDVFVPSPIVFDTFLARVGVETPDPWVPPAANASLAPDSVEALVPPFAIGSYPVTAALEERLTAPNSGTPPAPACNT